MSTTNWLSFNCCVVRCVGFGGYTFPEDLTIRKLWMQAISTTDWHPTSESVVCPKHFLESDFEISADKFQNLKSDAVPSVFEWKTNPMVIENKRFVYKRLTPKRKRTCSNDDSDEESCQNGQTVPEASSYIIQTNSEIEPHQSQIVNYQLSSEPPPLLVRLRPKQSNIAEPVIVSREKRCRTCLSKPGNHNIFKLPASIKSILTDLLYIADIVIQEGDGLPAEICDECLQSLCNAHTFKIQCETSHRILMQEIELDKQIIATQGMSLFHDFQTGFTILKQSDLNGMQISQNGDSMILQVSENGFIKREIGDHNTIIVRENIQGDIVESDDIKTELNNEDSMVVPENIGHDVVTNEEQMSGYLLQPVKFENYVVQNNETDIDQNIDKEQSEITNSITSLQTEDCAIYVEHYDDNNYEEINYESQIKTPEGNITISTIPVQDRTAMKDDSYQTQRSEFQCNVCSHICTTRAALIDHFSKHCNKAVYACYICNSLFVQQLHVKKHLKTHSKEELNAHQIRWGQY